MSTELPVHLVVDAGPLIGLLNRRDAYHADAVRGFARLAAGRTAIVLPLPIVFEVFKWLLYRADTATARAALPWMLEDFDVVYPGPIDLEEIARLLAMRPTWSGSLEDASIAFVAIRMAAPVWTVDYRDLAAFPDLEFWSPA